MEIKKKIRVALMTQSIDGRLAMGTAIVARKAVESLINKQDEFELTFLHYEKSDEKIYSQGIREIIFPKFKFNVLNKRSLRFFYYLITNKDEFDIVLWFQARLYPFFWYFKAKKKIVWVHGAGDWGKEAGFALWRFLYNWNMRIFSGKVDLAMAGSDFARKDVAEKYGFKDEKKVIIMHYGAENCYYRRSGIEIKKLKEKFNLPENFLLNVARLNPGKNAFRVIRAFDKFCEKNPNQSIHFVNLGAQGVEEKEVKDFISKSKYKDRIHLIAGAIDRDNELPTLYSACYALVFPLLNEGFGLPLMEAMRCGVPTISSNTCYPDITDKETILVNALSEESIADGMRQIVEDKILYDKLVKNGLEFSKNFTWEKMGENLLKVFRKILK